MADYLPPVVARLSFDGGDFFAGLAKAKAAMQGLSGEMNIKTDGLDAAAAKVAALSKAMSGLEATVKVNTDGLGTLAAKTTATAAATSAATGIIVNGWRLTGNAIHWIVAGGAELAAVTLPAMVAFGAAAAVMIEGSVNIAEHMTAVYDATEATSTMFGQTVGSVLGLRSALQEAQTAADPSIYGILGSAVITVKEHFQDLAQTGLQVVQMFQGFAAKVAVDFGPGGSMGSTVNTLLAHMTTDLQGIGQVFGNLGHALASFAAQMPGLAEVLLKGLVGLTGFAEAAINFAGSLKIAGVSVLTLAMGFEEFNRWGGLVATVLTKIGLAGANLEGSAFSFTRLASVLKGFASVVPTVISQVGALVARFSEGGGEAMASFASDLEESINGLSTFGAIAGGAAVAGLAALIYKLVTAKDSVQQLAASLQQAVEQSSNANAFQTIVQNVAQLNAQLPQVQRNFAAIARQNMGAATDGMQELSAATKQQIGDLANIAQGAQAVGSTYHTSFAGALELADLANVKLANFGSQSKEIMAQIAGVVQGFMAMGAPASEVGRDITVLGIQSGLAATQVSDLNSAWDQFVSGLTGGTSNLAQLGEALTNLSTGASNVTNVLGKAAAIKESIQGFAASLKTFTAAGAQAWQSFDSALSGPGEQLIDWFRTAGAEGAATGKQLSQAVLDIASSFVPLATQSKTAQAEILGLVQEGDPAITTFSQLQAAVKNSGASFSGLNGLVSSATQKMANMQSVANTLGSTLTSALTAALNSGQVSASGASAAMEKYSNDLMTAGANASSTQGAYTSLMGDLEKLGLSAQQAAAMIATVTQNLNAMPTSKTITITTDLVTQSISSGGGVPVGVRAPGHAAGTPSAAPGWSWVGEAGPELIKLRGGETILPNSVSMGYANGAGDFGGGDIHLYIDGRELSGVISKRAIQTQRRTGSTGMTRRAR